MELMIPTVNCSSDPAQTLVAHYKDASLHEEGINEHDQQQLAGFIFMCNGRSKPQCYQYRVFGLPLGRMEIVKKIKPGMKLFLYDFELKLLYGIYEATTIGTLNLEQAAFNGRFPAQVGFNIYKECMPLLESSFKHAIERDHQNSNKFNQELNKQQVENLLSMFRPLTARAHSSLRPMLHQDVHNQSSLPFYKKSCTQILHSQHVQQIGPWQHDRYRAQLGMGQVDPVMEPQLPLNLVDQDVQKQSSLPYYKDSCTEVLHYQHVQQTGSWQHDGYRAQLGKGQVNPVMEPTLPLNLVDPNATGMKLSYVPPASELPYYVPQAAPSLQQQHVGSTTSIGYCHQTMGKQVLLTENDQYYLSEVQQPYGTMGVNQKLVTSNWRQLPLQRVDDTVQRQDGFFQYYN